MGHRGRSSNLVLSVELSSELCTKLELYIITGVAGVEAWGLCEERRLVCVK